MGFITDLVTRGNGILSEDWNNAIKSFLTGEDVAPINTSAGKPVTAQTSLTVSAVYSCVRIIAWTIASLPLIVYERMEPRGKERATKNSTYNILKNKPNEEQTPFEYMALTSVHQNLWGAGISEIEFDKKGNPVALWPIPPWTVEPIRIAKNQLAYKVNMPDGSFELLSSYQVLVFPALNTTRDRWMSPIAVHRETVGLSMAMKDFGAKVFGQGTNPAGVISFQNKMPKEYGEESVRKKFRDNYAGLSNSHRLMLLDDGAKFERVGIPPEDAQYLESQKFGISEIARIYNVPLHLLQMHEKSSSFGKGLEEMTQGFITYSLRPYLVQWEQEINRKLIFDPKYYAEFLVDALLRGNLIDRYNAYQIGRNGGWLSADDIRVMENMNPLPDGQGEQYLIPLNMTNAENINSTEGEPEGDNDEG